MQGPALRKTPVRSLAAGEDHLAAGDAPQDEILPPGVQLREHIVQEQDGPLRRCRPETAPAQPASATAQRSGSAPGRRTAWAGWPLIWATKSSLWGPERQDRASRSALAWLSWWSGGGLRRAPPWGPTGPGPWRRWRSAGPAVSRPPEKFRFELGRPSPPACGRSGPGSGSPAPRPWAMRLVEVLQHIQQAGVFLPVPQNAGLVLAGACYTGPVPRRIGGGADRSRWSRKRPPLSGPGLDEGQVLRAEQDRLGRCRPALPPSCTSRGWTNSRRRAPRKSWTSSRKSRPRLVTSAVMVAPVSVEGDQLLVPLGPGGTGPRRG